MQVEDSVSPRASCTDHAMSDGKADWKGADELRCESSHFHGLGGDASCRGSHYWVALHYRVEYAARLGLLIDRTIA